MTINLDEEFISEIAGDANRKYPSPIRSMERIPHISLEALQDINHPINDKHKGKKLGGMVITETAVLYIALGNEPYSPWGCPSTLKNVVPVGTRTTLGVTGDHYRTERLGIAPPLYFHVLENWSDLRSQARPVNFDIFGKGFNGTVINPANGQLAVSSSANTNAKGNWTLSGGGGSITPTGTTPTQPPRDITGDQKRKVWTAPVIGHPFLILSNNFTIRQRGSEFNKAGSGKRLGSTLYVEGKLTIATGSDPEAPWREQMGGTLYTPT